VNTQEIQHQIATAVQMAKDSDILSGSMTNNVTINFVANAQLAVGGSAAMTYMPDEGENLARNGGSMYINVGTMQTIYEESLPHTAQVLHELHKPWVLDPVAIGSGKIRTYVLKRFKEYKPSVVRGNASEIIALANLWGLLEEGGPSRVRGVDSTDSVLAAKEAAIALAKWTGGAVAVSGETDLVTDGNHLIMSYGGSVMMTRITGSGCSLGGVIAVYAAVASPFIAALTGTNLYNVAGKRAAAKAGGTGTFQMYFLDELYNATPQDVSENEITAEEV
jgi:hydroxyethylthiazole kinase